jgi:hypothetical protein
MRSDRDSGKLAPSSPTQASIMSNPDSSLNPLLAFSDRIATLVEDLGRGVVALAAGRGSSVAAFAWQPGVLVTVAHAIRHGGTLRLIGAVGA